MNPTDIKTSDLKDFFLANLEENKSRNQSAQREKAIQYFKELDLPTTKQEEWKYTNLNALLKTKFQTEEVQTDSVKIQPFLFKDENINQLVFINGFYSKELSHMVSPASQITVKNLKELDAAEINILDQYSGTLGNIETDAFTALNVAMAEEGVFIHIPDNQIVEQAVMLYFIGDANRKNIASQVRNLWIAGKNSQVKVIEKFDMFGENSIFNNVFTEVFVAENANFQHYKIQNEQGNAFQVNTTTVEQKQSSTYTNITISLDGKIIRNNLTINLAGQHCEANMYGLYMLKGNTLVDNHTAVDHQQPNSLSNELYKGILDEKSSGVFNGKIFVRQIAQKTNAYQQNRNVILSNDASVNTKPQLEIWADDVKCSHGATTGSIDKDALFYLRSRGVAEEEAKALLIYAFANDIVEKMTLGNLKNYLEEILLNRLGMNI